MMKDEDFVITENKDRESTAFFVKGRVNTVNAGELECRLESSVRENALPVILNMSQVEYLSSAGIKVILKIYKLAKETGKKFNIESPSDSVRNVLGLTALDELLLRQ